MGPYDTLGVPKDCTCAQAREAFRAKARSAHPDRGGDVATFIRLRHAYEEIIAELDRVGAPVEDNLPQPPPARPPDPAWEPELILRDEPPACQNPPRPPDPNWNPELILVDGERDGPDLGASGHEFPRRDYHGWVRTVAEASERRGSISSSPWPDWSGPAALLLVVLLLCALVYWAATANLEKDDLPASPAVQTLGLGTRNAPPTITNPANMMIAPALIAMSGPKNWPGRLERLAIASTISCRFEGCSSAGSARGRRRTIP
jgi:hypothetical protein